MVEITFLCLSICIYDNSKRYERTLMNFLQGTLQQRRKLSDFGGERDSFVDSLT